MVYSSSSVRENGRGSDRSSFKTSDSKISRSYRSPPSRGHNESGHRSRKDSSPLPDDECLSEFYKKRFGSTSPEDYLNLRMSHFDRSLGSEDIKVILEREFKHLAPLQIKIVRHPEDDERLAYVNFEGRDCAKSVRRNLVSRLRRVLGKNITIDPAGVVRDQEGNALPHRINKAAMMGGVKRGHSPTHLHPQKFRRSIGSIGLPVRKENFRPLNNTGSKLNQDDEQAGRTLFVGNLPGDIRESELKRTFEEYGTVEEVDIKTLQDNNAAYAFILMGTVEDAIEARQEQHDKPIRPGGKHCQLGYGKTQVSSRLIIGGLGLWTTKEMLEKAFERYGEIETVDFEEGDDYGYIQYKDSGPAVDATGEMKNFPLGGTKDTSITVDFIRDPNSEKTSKQPIRKRPSSPTHPNGGKKRLERDSTPSPSHSPTRAGFINTFDQLKERVAATWKGFMLLKKTDYLLSFYRLYGREHLIQEFLRDKWGASIKLTINQRLPIVPDLYQKLIDFDQKELALILAVEAEKPIEPLVKYLQEKSAAGVITIENACLYVFPYCEISEKLVKFFAPRIKFITPESQNCMIIALKKTQTIQQQQLMNNTGLNDNTPFKMPSLPVMQMQTVRLTGIAPGGILSAHSTGGFLPPLA